MTIAAILNLLLANSFAAVVASNMQVYAFPNVRKLINLDYVKVWNGTYMVSLYALPTNGKVEYFDALSGTYKPLSLAVTVPTTTLYYTSNPGFTGTDIFRWTLTETIGGVPTAASRSTTVMMKPDLYGKDWPQYRYGPHRDAETSMTLPDTLHLQWTLQLPAIKAAWNYDSMQKWDQGYEPVLMGKTIFIASNQTDKLIALDTATGAEKWSFYTGGPIRCAPVAWSGKVYIGSDDGYLYCLDATTGNQIWKFRGGPSDRMAFGNDRMMSLWPIRSGPIMSADGTLYFACGVWPFDGIFVYGLNPTTGAVVWKNDGAGNLSAWHPRGGSPSVGGLSPQGHPVINWTGNKVLFPQGHAMPGWFDRATGKMDHWFPGSSRNRNMASAWIDAKGVSMYKATGGMATLKVIAAGSKTYTTGPGVVESVHTLIAGDDKLFVVSKSGKFYCFGGNVVASPPARTISKTTLPTVSDHWAGDVSTMLTEVGVPEGSCVVLGVGSGRLIEELAKQSKFQIDVFEPDSAKADALRQKLDDAGYYGTRANVSDTAKVAVHQVNPADVALPSYGARLIASEDMAAAGFSAAQAFVNRLYSGLRPYGGMIWLFTSSTEHSAFSSWVSSMSLSQAVVARSGAYSSLKRPGALPGSTDFTKTAATFQKSPDQVAKAPFGSLWWSDKYFWGVPYNSDPLAVPDVANGFIISSFGKSYDVYTGLELSQTQVWSGGPKVVNSIQIGKSTRTNPFNGLPEPRDVPEGKGCGGGMSAGRDYGYMLTRRSSTPTYFDLRTESGSVNVAGMRPGCGDHGMIPANGVFILSSGTQCSCEYAMRSGLALVHRPDADQFANWEFERTAQTIEEEPIRKIAFNFGTFGDRMDNGLLWLHSPMSTQLVPLIPVILSGTVKSYHHDNSWVQGSGLKWIASSGIEGVTAASINLSYPTVVSKTTVSAPAVDGSVTDPCWDGSRQVPLYDRNIHEWYKKNSVTAPEPVLEKSLNPLPAGAVTFRHNATHLYAALKYQGDISGTTSGLNPPYVAWDLFISDRVNASTKYLHFRVRKDGTRYQAKYNTATSSNEDKLWAGVWDSGHQFTPSSLNVEMGIPWSTISAEGLDKNNLVVNVQGPKNVYYNGGLAHNLQLRALPGEWIEAAWTAFPCKRFNPLYLDTVTGDLDKVRSYKVRMHFAEPENYSAGQRVFDIGLQGTTVASNFDIVSQAGGVRKPFVKEFTNIQIKDILNVSFTPKVGVPVICGMEIIENGSVIPDTTAPAVPTSLVATAASSSQINLSWGASTDSGGSGLAGYKIYRGGTLISSTSSTTYSDTGLTASTAYSYQVSAHDIAGNESAKSSSASATTFAGGGDTTLPTVAVTAPLAGATISGSTTISASASDDTGVVGVQFKVDGINVGAEDASAPHSISWNSTTVANGSHTITATARDAAGNSRTSTGVTVTVNNVVTTDSDSDGLLDSWEVAHFGSISDPRALPNADPDGDGFTNEAELKAGTLPLSRSSRLSVADQSFVTSSSFKVQWQSVANKTYQIQSSLNMSSWTPVTNVTASSTSATWTDSGVSAEEKKFYRVVIP